MSPAGPGSGRPGHTESAESSGRKSAPMNAFGKHQETSLLKTPHPQQSLVRASLGWSCAGQGVQGRWARSQPVLGCGGRLVRSQDLQILKFTTLKNNRQIPTYSVYMGENTHLEPNSQFSQPVPCSSCFSGPQGWLWFSSRTSFYGGLTGRECNESIIQLRGFITQTVHVEDLASYTSLE